MLKIPTVGRAKRLPMDCRFYSLILTRSTHTVTAETAAAIRRALEAGQRTVEVDIPLFADQMRRTLISTAHVVAIAEDRSERLNATSLGEGNVHFIRAKRASQ